MKVKKCILIIVFLVKYLSLYADKMESGFYYNAKHKLFLFLSNDTMVVKINGVWGSYIFKAVMNNRNSIFNSAPIKIPINGSVQIINKEKSIKNTAFSAQIIDYFTDQLICSGGVEMTFTELTEDSMCFIKRINLPYAMVTCNYLGEIKSDEFKLGVLKIDGNEGLRYKDCSVKLNYGEKTFLSVRLCPNVYPLEVDRIRFKQESGNLILWCSKKVVYPDLVFKGIYRKEKVSFKKIDMEMVPFSDKCLLNYFFYND